MDNKMNILEITSEEPLTNDERLMLYGITYEDFEKNTGMGRNTLYRARGADASLDLGTKVKIRQYLHTINEQKVA